MSAFDIDFTIPLAPARVQGLMSGRLRLLTQPQNFGTITPGIDSPAKIFTCGIVTDAQDRFITHIHETYLDYLHFVELRPGVAGGCALCEEGVPLIRAQRFQVIGGRITFMDIQQLNPYLIQMHPE